MTIDIEMENRMKMEKKKIMETVDRHANAV